MKNLQYSVPLGPRIVVRGVFERKLSKLFVH